MLWLCKDFKEAVFTEVSYPSWDNSWGFRAVSEGIVLNAEERSNDDNIFE